MKNKELAFDLLSSAIRNPANTINLDEIAAQIGPEDIAELTALFPQVQYAAKLQQQQLAFQQQQNVTLIENSKHTFGTLTHLKDSLHEAMQQARKGYAYVMWMYIITFYLGIALIITAVVFAAMDKTILAIAFGTIGLIDIIVYLLKKPPLELQASRSNYAQLSSALISWFSDLMNLNSYMSTLPPGTSFNALSDISDKQFENTKKLMEMIEQYSEPGWTEKQPKQL